jgi:hypothetical protein
MSVSCILLLPLHPVHEIVFVNLVRVSEGVDGRERKKETWTTLRIPRSPVARKVEGGELAGLH